MAEAREGLTELVAVASALFYLAEHGEDPQVKSIWDAFHDIATSLSVGDANTLLRRRGARGSVGW